MRASQGSILSQAPVTPTNPHSIPLQRVVQSNLLTCEYVFKIWGFTKTAIIPEVEPDSHVLIIILAGVLHLGTNKLNCLPPLKNNQATQRTKVP